MDDDIEIECEDCGWTGGIDDCNTPYDPTDLYCPECGAHLTGE